MPQSRLGPLGARHRVLTFARMSRRVVVIGGGAIGMASAYFLNRSGWDVTVIDRGEIGHGCSYGNACLIVASHSKPIAAPGVIGQALRWMLEKDAPFYIRPRLDSSLIRWTWQFRRYCQAAAVERAFPVLLRLSRESLRLYDTLRSSGEADFFFERRGLLEVFLSDAGVDSAPHTREELEAAGFTVRLLSPGNRATWSRPFLPGCEAVCSSREKPTARATATSGPWRKHSKHGELGSCPLVRWRAC